MWCPLSHRTHLAVELGQPGLGRDLEAGPTGALAAEACSLRVAVTKRYVPEVGIDLLGVGILFDFVAPPTLRQYCPAECPGPLE